MKAPSFAAVYAQDRASAEFVMDSASLRFLMTHPSPVQFVGELLSAEAVLSTFNDTLSVCAQLHVAQRGVQLEAAMADVRRSLEHELNVDVDASLGSLMQKARAAHHRRDLLQLGAEDRLSPCEKHLGRLYRVVDEHTQPLLLALAQLRDAGASLTSGLQDEVHYYKKQLELYVRARHADAQQRLQSLLTDALAYMLVVHATCLAKLGGEKPTAKTAPSMVTETVAYNKRALEQFWKGPPVEVEGRAAWFATAQKAASKIPAPVTDSPRKMAASVRVGPTSSKPPPPSRGGAFASRPPTSGGPRLANSVLLSPKASPRAKPGSATSRGQTPAKPAPSSPARKPVTPVRTTPGGRMAASMMPSSTANRPSPLRASMANIARPGAKSILTSPPMRQPPPPARAANAPLSPTFLGDTQPKRGMRASMLSVSSADSVEEETYGTPAGPASVTVAASMVSGSDYTTASATTAMRNLRLVTGRDPMTRSILQQQQSMMAPIPESPGGSFQDRPGSFAGGMVRSMTQSMMSANTGGPATFGNGMAQSVMGGVKPRIKRDGSVASIVDGSAMTPGVAKNLRLVRGLS